MNGESGSVTEGDGIDDRQWLRAVLATLRARLAVIAATVVAAVLLAVVYLHVADYTYTATLRVSAAPSNSGDTKGLGSLGGLASLAGIGDATSQPVTPFRLYLEGIYSREIAERLSRRPEIMHAVFAREWDPRTRGWRSASSLGSTARNLLLTLVGLTPDPWQAPNGARLQEFIAAAVDVRESVKTPLVTISTQSTDPKFATRLLGTLGTTVDEFLREQSQARTRGNIAYLSDKLRVVTLAEQRQALFAALSDQERQMMLANGTAPYAADPFGAPTASLRPTSPRPVPVLIGGVVAGLIAGLTLAILIGPRRVAPDLTATPGVEPTIR